MPRLTQTDYSRISGSETQFSVFFSAPQSFQWVAKVENHWPRWKCPLLTVVLKKRCKYRALKFEATISQPWKTKHFSRSFLAWCEDQQQQQLHLGACYCRTRTRFFFFFFFFFFLATSMACGSSWAKVWTCTTVVTWATAVIIPDP